MQMIKYRSGYKYQLTEDYCTITRIRPLHTIRIAYITLTPDGELTGHAGYAWDGPSGPTFDTRTFLRGSCGHDMKYQLIRLGLIDHYLKVIADDELREDCLEDGMWKVRAWWVWAGVSKFGRASTLPSAEPPILSAP